MLHNTTMCHNNKIIYNRVGRDIGGQEEYTTRSLCFTFNCSLTYYKILWWSYSNSGLLLSLILWVVTPMPTLSTIRRHFSTQLTVATCSKEKFRRSLIPEQSHSLHEIEVSFDLVNVNTTKNIL